MVTDSFFSPGSRLNHLKQVAHQSLSMGETASELSPESQIISEIALPLAQTTSNESLTFIEGEDNAFVIPSSNDTRSWGWENRGSSRDEWQELSDPTSGYQYWHNSRTGESMWEDPLAQAPWPQLEGSDQPDPSYYLGTQREGGYEAVSAEQYSDDMAGTGNQLALVEIGQSEDTEGR